MGGGAPSGGAGRGGAAAEEEAARGGKPAGWGDRQGAHPPGLAPAPDLSRGRSPLHASGVTTSEFPVVEASSLGTIVLPGHGGGELVRLLPAIERT